MVAGGKRAGLKLAANFAIPPPQRTTHRYAAQTPILGAHAMSLRRSKITRRDVLKSGAALAGAACLPRWFVEENRALAAPETSKSPNERIGILLVGCGGMGNGDARLAQQFGDIVAVCD